MEPGQIVEFIEGKRLVTGMVSRIKGGKLLILTETDRELSVAGNRILDHSGPKLDLDRSRFDHVRSLKEIIDRRQSLMEKVDLVELWELLEGEGEEFNYFDLAGLSLPEPIGPDEISALFPRCLQ